MRIDLHTHSTASDGTDAPAALIAAAAAAGLDVVALTDHDTTAGWDQAATAAAAGGVTLVRGAEISCARDGVSLHLLAYLFDPTHAALTVELTRARDDRVPRAQEIVRRLAAAGHPVDWDAVLAQAQAGATVGRPHIADALVAAGVARDRNEAFAELLYDGGPFHVRHYAPDPERVVRLVREAGGVPIIAHPGAALRGKVVSDDLIAMLAAAGLAALEVDHRDHDGPTRARLRGLAADLGVLVTGASDYHGSGKDNLLGENTTDPEVYAALVDQATGPTAVLVP